MILKLQKASATFSGELTVALAGTPPIERPEGMIFTRKSNDSEAPEGIGHIFRRVDGRLGDTPYREAKTYDIHEEKQ